MAGKIESGRKKILNKVKLGVLYLTIQVKILLLGALFLRGKSLKGLLPFLMGLLLLVSPGILPAQTPEWPWVFGESLELTTDTDDNFSPAVASNDLLYFVAWYKSTPSGFKVYGARIDRSGKVFEDDKGGVPICTGQGDQMFPAVSWNGKNFFVVWQDRRSGRRWDIYGARIAVFSRFLSVLDPEGIPIAVGKSSLDQVGPSVAFDGENQLVVWRAKHTNRAWSIYCRFMKAVNEEEVTLDDRTIQVSASSKDQASSAVIFNPDNGNYFVVWQDKRNGKFWDIYGARIALDGTPMDPGDIQISSNNFDQWNPTLSWNGRYYLIAWTASPDGGNWYIYGKMFDSEGRPQDYADIQLQGDGTSKAFPAIVAGTGEEQLLVWEEGPGENSNISGAVIVPGYRIFTGAANQISDPQETDASIPVLSKSGNDLLVVWQAKSPEGYWGIYSVSLFLKPKPGQ